ncbi:hypothetical protein EVAR_3251_1 [Eumeta japonica]|uniref:Uncharacterized protein n=1 Tax=Eumeta variegata TaxID=151549 RepID=A0A4C1SVR1_EUMVA|nr:hypothetical protein EVAR_3251_1 [Eumeta japonica]
MYGSRDVHHECCELPTVSQKTDASNILPKSKLGVPSATVVDDDVTASCKEVHEPCRHLQPRRTPGTAWPGRNGYECKQ